VVKSSIIKSLGASILFGIVFCGCATPPVQSARPIHSRLDVYELAFHLYFREEQKENAIGLLAWACKNLNDERHVSCYDLGYLLARENRPDEAARAFEESNRIKPNRSALAALYELYGRGVETRPTGPRVVVVAKEVERRCRAGKPADALNYLKDAVREQPPIQLSREMFAQPFFAECLKNQAGYQTLIQGFQSVPPVAEEVYRFRAALHPLRDVWDVLPSLRGEFYAFQSLHPVNSAWRNFIDAVRRNDLAQSERQLRAFYAALDAKGGHDLAAITVKRAAGTLIAGDPFFIQVKNSIRVQQMVRDSLPGSGLFEHR